MSRVVWVDAAKGVGILLVVAGHALRGLNERGLIDPVLFEAVDRRIYAFHMPLFFMLSGLFFLEGLRRAEAGPFLRARVMRLLYPLFLWTYVFIGAKVLAGSLANAPLSAEEMLVSPVPGRWHFWFLWALFLIQVLLLLARPVLGRMSEAAFAAGVLAVSVALLLADWPGGVLYWAGSAIWHLPFFALGMLVGLGRGDLRVSAAGAAVALAVFVLLLATVPSWDGSLLVRTLGGAILCLCVGAMVIWMAPGRATPVLALLGSASMAIYLTHTIFSAGLREVLLRVEVQGTLAHFVLGTAIGILAPLLLWQAARVTGLQRWAGF